MDRLNQLRLGRSRWTTESTDPLWACTGCRHCTMYCDHGNEPGLVLLSGPRRRRRARRPASGARRLQRTVPRPRAAAVRAARDDFDDHLATEGEIGFWPGCDAIDKGAADIAAALALFERVGLEDVKIVDAPQACAGYPLLAAGHSDLFRWHAGRVAASLRGFRKVAINCSACLYAMRAQYAAEGVNVRTEIVSLADLLAPAASNLACSLNASSRSTTTTPAITRATTTSSSSRAARSRSSPRFASSRWNKTDTECCGGGGLLPKTMPLIADQMAKRRLAEVQATGGGMVVTSCATCTFMLKRNAPPSVEVANLATAMAQLSETPFTAPRRRRHQPIPTTGNRGTRARPARHRKLTSPRIPRHSSTTNRTATTATMRVAATIRGAP